jgi:hypothetical protein
MTSDPLQVPPGCHIPAVAVLKKKKKNPWKCEVKKIK